MSTTELVIFNQTDQFINPCSMSIVHSHTHKIKLQFNRQSKALQLGKQSQALNAWTDSLDKIDATSYITYYTVSVS